MCNFVDIADLGTAYVTVYATTLLAQEGNKKKAEMDWKLAEEDLEEDRSDLVDQAQVFIEKRLGD